MKRNTYHLSAALALLLGLAACTQDELSSPSGGVEGAAMTFTATGLNSAATAAAGTRAPVDGDWEGVQSVAVMIGGKVKAYDVTPTTADNTSATLTSTDPHYWADHNDLRVTARWPYNGEENLPAVKVRADQSARKNFEGSDLIVAEEQTVSYGNPTLRFTHRTARVTVILTDYTEERIFVRLTGLSTENGNPAVIAPYYDKGGDTYIALVAPQTVAAGTAFITCKFTNGKVFVYKMQNDAEWKAGEEYTYTVSLAAAEDPGYTVSEDGKTYTVYTDDGLKNVAKLVNEEGKTDINITLDTDLTLTGEWTPIGTSFGNPYTGTFDGGGHTITGLTVNQKERGTVGLIGDLGSGGKVQNLTLENVNLNGNLYVGSVVGYSNNGTVTACTASGSINGKEYVGGIVGSNYLGTVTACYNTSSTVNGSYLVGGVVGQNNKGIVTACYNASGSIYGEGTVGGVVGDNYTSTVTACYWSNYAGYGIGNGTGDATKVDGTTVTWQTAVDAMNAALRNAGSEWRYELTGELPTLKK